MAVGRNPIAYLGEEYERLKEEGLTWEPRELQGPSEPVSVVEGREVVVLCSNN